MIWPIGSTICSPNRSLGHEGIAVFEPDARHPGRRRPRALAAEESGLRVVRDDRGAGRAGIAVEPSSEARRLAADPLEQERLPHLAEGIDDLLGPGNLLGGATCNRRRCRAAGRRRGRSLRRRAGRRTPDRGCRPESKRCAPKGEPDRAPPARLMLAALSSTVASPPTPPQ